MAMAKRDKDHVQSSAWEWRCR